MCKLADTYINPGLDSVSCKLRSLADYVAELHDKSCYELTEQDVKATRTLLESCAPVYYETKPTSSAKHNSTRLIFHPTHPDSLTTTTTVTTTADSRCAPGGVLHTILFIIAPVGYMKPNSNDSNSDRLSQCMAYLDIPGLDGQSFYLSIFQHGRVEEGNVYVSALGLEDQQNGKYDLFNYYLIGDIKYFGLAGALVLFLMLVYLRSIVLMIATVINIIMSFILAYFIYFVVLRLEFFPFINILAGLVLIAVGADDVFIFYDSWVQARLEVGNRPRALEQAMSKAF